MFLKTLNVKNTKDLVSALSYSNSFLDDADFVYQTFCMQEARVNRDAGRR